MITCSVPDTQLSTGKIKKKKTHAPSSEFVVWERSWACGLAVMLQSHMSCYNRGSHRTNGGGERRAYSKLNRLRMLRKASRRHLERQMELANGRRKELVKKLVKTLSFGSYKQNKLAE